MWVILGQSIVQMNLSERHSHQQTQRNYSAANRSGALLTLWHSQGLSWHCVTSIQRTTRLLTFAGSTPSVFSRMRMSTNAASHTQLLYLGCAAASLLPLCSAHLFSCATPLHSALLSPLPLFILPPLPDFVRLWSTSAQSQRQ